MQSQERIEEMVREFRRFKQELPAWADALQRQEACGKGGPSGSVRAYRGVSGDVSRVEVETYFLRSSQTSRVESAVLEALRNAESAASRMITEHQEKLDFMDLPIGELLSGKRSVEDVLPVPPSLAKHMPNNEENR